jgi:2,3-bisphosphoglycerate-independent phosphoglycerate mutase
VIHRAARETRVLLIFLDGVGIGARDPLRNPFFASPPPFLTDVLDGRLPSMRVRDIDARDASCIPLDATLGVAGLPQSGTGQTALYAGFNAARTIGQHFGPYVYSTLKPLLAEHSIFQRLLDDGHAREDIALANAFPQRFFDYIEGPRKRMVAGMFAAIASAIPFRAIGDLERGDAVSADITAERWKDIGHPEAPVITPYAAGRVLARIAEQHRFTLFEYFLTDKAGHERSHHMAATIIHHVDDFLRGVFEHTDRADTITLVTSDHGNLEDLSTKTHTRNPVPLIAFGRARHDLFPRLTRISDIAPAIATLLRA